MQRAIDQYRENQARVRTLNALGEALAQQVAAALDISDVHRAALVLGVSAFDHYVHEVARLGMIEIYTGSRTATPKAQSFRIPLSHIATATSDPGSFSWLDTEIRSQHGWVSFQQADKVADALRLVTTKVIWDEVGTILGTNARDCKLRLNLIVDRRNKIAHEADIDPSAPGVGMRWIISAQMVSDSVDYLDSVVDAIHSVL